MATWHATKRKTGDGDDEATCGVASQRSAQLHSGPRKLSSTTTIHVLLQSCMEDPSFSTSPIQLAISPLVPPADESATTTVVQSAVPISFGPSIVTTSALTPSHIAIPSSNAYYEPLAHDMIQ
ncbi:Hypothetical predicted protein [Olea europaea subsp. europaea]|uniref:Uncharacterized protein n=1 Tax=Olea europaea subsp. europaea TaxID=158383 RepID=A0A8S0PF82_OLEEU|nr:Hypothetical predicted protein [Olea europaea subsp. europaea]